MLANAQLEGRAPWNALVIETKYYNVYKDAYPVTEGHILFVPTDETWDCLQRCYKAAYSWGYGWVQDGFCDAYNIGQNVGEEAGQTVMYPHVHLIPRRRGDMKNPAGGVRHVIPEKGNYKITEDTTISK